MVKEKILIGWESKVLGGGGGGDIALNVENIGLKNKIESSNVIFKRNYILNLIVYICPI